MTVLDAVVWHALTGHQAHLGRRVGDAVAFDPAVSPFAGLRDLAAPDWPAMAALAGPGGSLGLAGAPSPLAPGWREAWRLPGIQFVATGTAHPAAPDAAITPLDADDVPDMLDLAARTKPGPFLARTPEFGGYLGVRVGGRLVAMAGERSRPPGHAEISAVCTDPAFRGHGYAKRLVTAVMANIVRRGETPFLHVVASNAGAIRLYEQLGFTRRRTVDFVGLLAPTA